MELRSLPALVISVVVHIMILAGLWAWKQQGQLPPLQLVVETVLTEERPQEEYTQEMAIDTTVSQTLAVTAGGAVTGQLGSSSANPVSAQNIETSEALKDPQINIKQFSRITTPGLGDINVDLGEGEVSGEIGAKVEGYGAAMHRITQEIRRMMRKNQVIVVWLFDSSYSLNDDRQEISDNFHKIYEELDIARKQAKVKGERYETLETMICSFGERIRKLTPKPTSNIKQIQNAIGRIEDDKTGKEMTFHSIKSIIDEYGRMARASDRKLAIVVLTDETGDDPEILENVITQAKLYKAPVYFLGREAIFGYPYAIMHWTNPETKITYDVRVNRGPETAMPECLQYTGFGGRWDSASSGFAPYPQARLVKESGGIFFMLQSKEKALTGSSARLNLLRKFDDIRMKQYEPDLLAVRDYVQRRDRSEFRKTIWDVILRLNPHLDNELNIGTWHLPIDHEEFKKEARGQFNRGVRALGLMKAALEKLDKVKDQRDLEPDARWRAAYDLVYAQLLAFRVRVFQYLLLMDQHVDTKPKPSDPKHNRWDRHYAKEMIEPTPDQVKAAKVDMAELEKQRQTALAMYDKIIKEHPGTPWAQRAQQEKAWGFGMRYISRFYDPKYFSPDEIAKIPKF